MLRTADKRLFLSEQLGQVLGGRDSRRYPNTKPGRLSGPTVPPVASPTAWWDPSDLATVTHTGGTGSAVADKSGNGKTLSASTEFFAYGSPDSLFRGRNAMWLTGNGGARLTGSQSMSDITSSAFAVVSVGALSSIRGILCSSGDGGIEFRCETTSGLLSLNKSDTAIIANTSSLAVTAGTPCVVGYTLGASSCDLWVNLSSETDAHAQTLTAGRTIVVGAAPASGGVPQYLGWIGEIVMYDTTLSSGDAQSVISYLMSKWGIR